MKRHEADKLIETIRGFVDIADDKKKPATVKATAQPDDELLVVSVDKGHVFDDVGSWLNADQLEKLYQQFKARFIDDAQIDPVLLHLIMVRPEIIVEVERKLVNLDGSTLKGRIARLLAAGWFKDARTSGAVRKELARTGSDPNSGQLSNTLGDFRRDGFLTNEGDGWLIAPGVKVTEKQVHT